MNNTMQAIILAAGKSTRFCTEKIKLAYPLCGQPMILFLTKLLEQLAIPITVVVGYQADSIKKIIIQEHGNSIEFITQEQQYGTGHALACTQPIWKKDSILVLNGDVPLITSDIIHALHEQHINNNAAISFVISCTTDETTKTYGRVVKIENSIAIVEAKDFFGNREEHCCINAGIYLINKQFLNDYISTLTTNNIQNEFYITDLVKIASDNHLPVSTFKASFNSVRGINTLSELSHVEHIRRSTIITYWMDRGVHFSFPYSVHIDEAVTIGAGSHIGSNVHLLGSTSIASNCIIKDFSLLDNVIMDSNSTINHHCILHNTHVKAYASVEPFSTTHTEIINSPNHLLHTSEKPSNADIFSFTGARIIHPLNSTDEQ